MNLYIRGQVFTVLIGLVFIIASCDVVDPVDPVENNNAHEPDINVLDIHEITPGQYLAGEFDINVEIDSSIGALKWVCLMVDDSIIGWQDYQAPYQFHLVTTDFPEGEHLVSIGLREEENDIGLLGLADVPTIFYSAPVVFDQTPPTPVVLDSVIWFNESPRLFWQASNDSNYYAYIISRNGNFGPFQSMGPTDSVFNRDSTAFQDTIIPMLYGIDMDYEVLTTNRAEYATSNAVNIHYGDTLAMTLDYQWIQPVLNPVHDILYAVMDSSINTVIKSFSTLDNSFVADGLVRGRTKGITVSKDGQRLFVLDHNQGDNVIIFDALTMAVADSFDLPLWSYDGDSRMVAGRDDRLYISTNVGSAYDSGSVRIINAYSGALEGETALGAESGSLLITSDNNTLYVAHRGMVSGDPAAIYRLDISTDTAIVKASAILTDDEIRAFQISPDNSLLYLAYGSDYIDVRDALTLTAVYQIPVPTVGSNLWPQDLYVTDAFVYCSIAADIPGAIYFKAGFAVKYDRSNLSVVDSWGCVMVPIFIIASQNEEFLYAFGLEPWLISMK